MFDWLNLVLPVVLVGLLGGLMTLAFLPRPARWNPPLVFTALTLGVIATGWLALVLAELGRFGRGSLLVALTASICVLFLWRRASARAEEPNREPAADEEKISAWEWLMLGVWLVAALWLFFRPHEYVYGGADAGVYVSLGAEIARNGGFRIVDETLAELSPELQAAVLRALPNTPGAASYLLPGFYVTDAAAGRLTPQFYPFHPVLQAVVFSAVGGGELGVRAELLLTGLWMLMGTLAVYLTARAAGGPVAGALVLAAMSLSALQVWFGRYPTSEALTQFVLWAGIWSGGRWLAAGRPSGLWAFTAGCAFGAVFLVRIDSLVLLPAFALLMVWRWGRGWERADTWFAVPFTLLVVHSLLHGHFLSAPYFYETVGYGLFLLQRAWALILAAVVVTAAVLWWLSRRANLRAPARLRRPALVVLLVFLFGYALYGWFLRPELSAITLRPDIFSGGDIPVTNHENWLRLGWYLTPLGVWLGVLGAGLLLWRVEHRTVLLLAIGWLFTVLYLWNVSANPHQVYVMRRYVPAVLPFLILGGGYLLGHRGYNRAGWESPPAFLARIPYPLGAALMAVVAVIWLAGIGWAARGFVSQVDNAGLTAQVDGLAAGLPAGAVLLFNDQSVVGQGDIWGTPLKFIYGYDVFTLRQPPESVTPALVETVKTWQNSGRPVIWIGDASWPAEQGFSFRTEQVTLKSERLESSYDHKPRDIVTDSVSLAVSYLESDENGSE